MPFHTWGDKDFDWDALNRAMSIIYEHMDEAEGFISMKEKYGTIRYEATWGLKSDKDFEILCNGVRDACRVCPNVRAEILEDLNWSFDNLPKDLKYVENE